MPKKVSSLLFFFLLFSAAIHAGKDPIKFKKVTIEELQQTHCPIDSSASAMILCNFGTFQGNDLLFTQIKRIKILKKEGTKHGNIIVYGSDDFSIQGFTFNVVDGKIEKSKLKKGSIFKENITGDQSRYRIAMPNVKVGSVIDIRISYTGLPSKWYFQSEIPVLHSELQIVPSMYIDFRKNLFGFESLEKSSENHFIAKNIPAFKEEAFITSRENYISKLEFDILKVAYPGYYKSYTTSWEALGKILLEHEFFGKVLQRSTNYLSDDFDQIIKELGENAEDIAKAKAAYQTIKKIKWNNETALIAEHNMLSSVYKDGSANSAELNLMLLQLLDKLEVKAYPVVLSTRSNGFVNPYFPSLEKLNYVIAYVSIDGKDYLMDATATHLPFGMLPERCLNGQARILTDNSSKLITLSQEKGNESSIVYSLKMDSEGTLSGVRRFTGKDYAASDFREQYRKYSKEEDFIKYVQGQHSGLNIDEIQIENMAELNQNIKADYHITLSNQLSAIDTILLLNPFCLEQIEENPFKLKDRKYPVDFSYPKSQSVVISLKLPEDYSISEVPESQIITLPGESAVAKLLYQGSGNHLSIKYTFQINKALFPPKEYTHLKTFYDKLINKQKEPVVLVRNQ